MDGLRSKHEDKLRERIVDN